MKLSLLSPVGVFEMAKFAAGTKGVMDSVVEVTKTGATTIIGLFIYLLKFVHNVIYLLRWW
jgi:hypothetical protein